MSDVTESQSSSNSLALNSNTEASANWARYMYGRTRGHDEYCERAAYLERMYLPGKQWSDEDKDTYTDRDLHEFNEIFPAVNAAIGYQIHNRMDIAFKPRAGEADENLASVRSKIAMQIADNNMLHWKETDVFTDGVIEQRGYLDLRIDYSDSVLGELATDVLDPRDVIPDPDAKSYNPDDWNDVVVTRWMTLDNIEQFFGSKVRMEVEAFRPSESDFGTDDQSGERSRFGDNANLNNYSEYDAWRDDSGMVQVRVIDRQKHKWAIRDVGIYPTGDIRPVKPEQIEQLVANGVFIDQRKIKIVERIISTKDMLLYKGDSELPFFSIIPFFPYFRRGKTSSLVDNGASPQEAYNKLITQYIHVINSTANSGWTVEEGSLTNMDTEELGEVGASTGLIVEYKKGSQPPNKIQPNQIPTGVDRMAERSLTAVRDSTIPESMRGLNDADNMSGKAKQSDQFASQQQLAICLDNLSRTRHILAKRIDWVITNFYDSKRIFRITGTDQRTGRKNTEEVSINVPQPDGTYYNDMTIGEYDVVISEQPMQVTFENSQFNQAIEMREKGVAIDDKIIVRYSNLADKHDIIDQMVQREKSAGQLNPLDQAKADLLAAQTQKELKNVDKIVADTAGVNVKAQFEAIQTGAQVLMNPGIVPVSDELLKSAGYKDHNGAPLVNMPQQQQQPQQVIDNVPQNTHPQFPANPPQPDQSAPVLPAQMSQPGMVASPVAGMETARHE